MRSTGETLPFQSFFYESENDIWRGKLLTLASYTEDPLGNPPFEADEKAAFEQAIVVLDGGRLVSGSTDLTPPFNRKGLNVTEAARVTHGSAPAGKGPWTVAEGADSCAALAFIVSIRSTRSASSSATSTSHAGTHDVVVA